MSNEITLKSKVGQLSDINQIIKPGSFVAIGGGLELQQAHGDRARKSSARKSAA